MKNTLTENNFTTRPWGSFEVILKSEKYQVKRIVVSKKSKLSLQSHKMRDEHWVVVSGTGIADLDDDKITLKENEHIFIPRNTKHRMSNNTDEDLVFIEVQYGDYLGEDDIIRYEDIYGRA